MRQQLRKLVKHCVNICHFAQDFEFMLQSRSVTRLFQMGGLTWSAAVTQEPRASITVPKVTSQQWRTKSYTVATMETGVFAWKNSVSTSLVLIGKLKHATSSIVRIVSQPLFTSNIACFSSRMIPQPHNAMTCIRDY